MMIRRWQSLFRINLTRTRRPRAGAPLLRKIIIMATTTVQTAGAQLSMSKPSPKCSAARPGMSTVSTIVAKCRATSVLRVGQVVETGDRRMDCRRLPVESGYERTGELIYPHQMHDPP